MTGETYLRSTPPPCRARDSPQWHVQQVPHTHCRTSLRHVRTPATTCYSLSGIKRTYKTDILVLHVTVMFLNNVTCLMYIYTDSPGSDYYLYWHTWYTDRPDTITHQAVTSIYIDKPDIWHTWLWPLFDIITHLTVTFTRYLLFMTYLTVTFFYIDTPDILTYLAVTPEGQLLAFLQQ